MAAQMHSPHRQKPPEAPAPTAEDVLVVPVPESRYGDVLDHVTPIFLRDEPLSQCFPPCTSGQREADFRSYATSQLESGLCVMAVATPPALRGSPLSPQRLAHEGVVVGSCLSRVLPRSKVIGVEVASLGSEDDDPLHKNVLRLLTSVHQQLDLFSLLGVTEFLEIGLASVEPTHVGRGLATKMIRASLELGAVRGLRASKADATGGGSAKACQRAGMTLLYTLPYAEYAPEGRVVFDNTGPSNPVLSVLAARLQPADPKVMAVDVKCSM